MSICGKRTCQRVPYGNSPNGLLMTRCDRLSLIGYLIRSLFFAEIRVLVCRGKHD